MIHPDNTLGAVMAMQGITDAAVLLHGQNGCRKPLVDMARNSPRRCITVTTDHPVYSGIQNIPYSGITTKDFNGNSQRKYDASLNHVCSDGYNLVSAFSSSGTSLLGDDLGKDTNGKIIMDSDDYEITVEETFDRTIRMVLENLRTDSDIIPGTVNVLGLSTMHKDWRAVRHEMEHILTQAGFKVLCMPGAGYSVSEMRNSFNAEYNLVLSPEFCLKTADLYEKEGSTVISSNESPIGFDAVSTLIDTIEEATARPMPGAKTMLKFARRRAFETIVQTDINLTGISFKINSVDSVEKPLSRWLSESFGMVETERDPDILFAGGDEAFLSERCGYCQKGIDIGFPSHSPPSFQNKPILGIDGAMYLLDEIFTLRM